MKPETAGNGAATATRCDLCDAPTTDERGLCTHVRDSSYLHPDAPQLDGDRPLTACSAEHLTELIKKMRARPFVDEELWAGKVARALAAHPQGLSLYALAMETELTQDQIAQAALWAGRTDAPHAAPAPFQRSTALGSEHGDRSG
ncbi:hypothetical protein [Streptomyces sp. NPDC058434]|uniref:hypothetical protein n=1 Tax=Streptomyces sp. NPDC058434 TaxID=3346498 RepID=UPI0036493AE2